MARVPDSSNVRSVGIAALDGEARRTARRAQAAIERRSTATQAAIRNAIGLPGDLRKLKAAHEAWKQRREEKKRQEERQELNSSSQDKGDKETESRDFLTDDGLKDSGQPLLQLRSIDAAELARTADLAKTAKSEAAILEKELRATRQHAEDEAFATSVTTKARADFSRILTETQEQAVSGSQNYTPALQRRLEQEAERLIDTARETGGRPSERALRNTRDRVDILIGNVVKQAAIRENNARVGKLTSDLEGGLAALADEVRKAPERQSALTEAADENIVGAAAFLPPERLLELRDQAQSEIAKAAVEGVLANDPTLAQEMLNAGDFGANLKAEDAATAGRRAQALIEGRRRDEVRQARLNEVAEASRLALERTRQAQQLGRSIARGDVGFAEVEDAFAAGQITEAQRDGLSRSVLERDRIRIREGEQVQRVADLLAGEGDPLNPEDPSDQEAVDLYWRRVALPGQEGLSDAEIMDDLISFLRQTGVVPSSVLVRTRVGLGSEDPQRRAAAARTVDALIKFVPDALSAFDDRELARGAIVAKLLQSGEGIEEALRRADKLVEVSPDGLEERQRQARELRLQEKATNALATRLGSDVPSAMTKDFLRLHEEFFLRTGDLELSRRLATRRLEAIWGNQGFGPTQRFVRRGEAEGEVRPLDRFRPEIEDRDKSADGIAEPSPLSEDELLRQAVIAALHQAPLDAIQQRMKQLGVDPNKFGVVPDASKFDQIVVSPGPDGQLHVFGAKKDGTSERLGFFGKPAIRNALAESLVGVGSNNVFHDLIPEDTGPIPPPNSAKFFSDLKDGLDLPVQVFAGILDGLENAADSMERIFPLGTFEIQNGKVVHRSVEPDAERGFPEIDRPRTAEGQVARIVGQFISTFLPVNKVLRSVALASGVQRSALAAGFGAKTAQAMGQVAQAELAALAAEQLAFDPFDERLSNLIEEIPELRNPVTGYLAADRSDTEAEARLKLALEGLAGSVLGVVAAGSVFQIIKGIRRARLGERVKNFAKKVRETTADVPVRPVGGSSGPDLSPGSGFPGERVQEFAEFARDAKGSTSLSKEKIELGGLTPEEAERITQSFQEVFGAFEKVFGKNIDLSQFKHVVTASGVRHVFKHHGDALAEEPRGLLPVTDEDFARIPALLETADEIKVSTTKTKRMNLPAVMYEKSFDDVRYKIVYVAEIRPGRKVLALQTMVKVNLASEQPRTNISIDDLLRE